MPPEIMETPPIPGIASFAGDRGSRPREGTFRRPPLGEFGCGDPSFAGDTRAAVWRSSGASRAASGGTVTVGKAGAPRGLLNPNYFAHPMRRHHHDDYRSA